MSRDEELHSLVCDLALEVDHHVLDTGDLWGDEEANSEAYLHNKPLFDKCKKLIKEYISATKENSSE